MIHQFKNNGYNIVIDINSGAIHVVDDVTYDFLALWQEQGRDDENMRGHLGTVLSQKAGTVLQCQKSKSGIINVTCPDARHGTMPRWTIRFDQDGHLADTDAEHRKRYRLPKSSAMRSVRQKGI